MLGARCCGDDMRWNVGRKRAGQLTRTSACRSTEIGATSGTEQQLQRRDHLREVPWLHVRGRVAGLLLLLCLLLEYLLQGTRIPASLRQPCAPRPPGSGVLRASATTPRSRHDSPRRVIVRCSTPAETRHRLRPI